LTYEGQGAALTKGGHGEKFTLKRFVKALTRFVQHGNITRRRMVGVGHKTPASIYN
jgi:hypothetical protein